MLAHWWPRHCFHCVSCHQAGTMAEPLLVSTKEKQRLVVCFYVQKVYIMLKFNICVCAQHWDNALDLRSVHKWTEMFKKGRTSVTDAEHSGCPSTTTSDKEQSLLQKLHKIKVSHGSVYNTVWQPRVPQSWYKQLTKEHNHSYMDTCSCHLEYYYNEELQLHHHWGWDLASLQTQQSPAHVMETHNFHYFQGIHIVAFTWRIYTNSVFWFPRPCLWLLQMWDYSNKCMVF